MSRRQTVLACLLLAAITFLVFGGSIGHGFVDYDDPMYVTNNPQVQKGISLGGTSWAFTHFYASNWHPLTWLSHMLDWQLFGQWAGGHHLTNVILHATIAVGLLLLLMKLTGYLGRSLFVAAIFAVHPLRVESVAWISERKDLLSGLFFLLTIWAYTGYARRPFSWTRYGAVAVSFAIGLMAKPMLVTLPAVLLLLDYWPLGRARSVASLITDRRLWIEKLPLFLLSAISCVVTIFAQQDAMITTERLPLFQRLENVAVAYAEYLASFFSPTGLCVLYPVPAAGSPAWLIGLSVTVLVSVTITVIVLQQSRPYLLVGWFWYLGMLVPVIGIVKVGTALTADRYTYLPQIGIALALVWGIADLPLTRTYRRTCCTVAAAGVIALMFCALGQLETWRCSESLWKRALDCTKENATAHFNLGTLWHDEHRLPEALAEFQAAARICPSSALTYRAMARVLLDLGQTTASFETYQRCLALDRDSLETQESYALALLQTGQLHKAAELYRTVLQRDPQKISALLNLGNALTRLNQTSEAIDCYESALRISPNNADVRSNLSCVLLKAGKVDSAIKHAEKATQLKPDHYEAFYNWGNALFDAGRWLDAVNCYEQALRIQPKLANAHYNAGLCLTRAGKRSEACQHLEEALRLALATNQQALANAVRRSLAALESKPQ